MSLPSPIIPKPDKEEEKLLTLTPLGRNIVKASKQKSATKSSSKQQPSTKKTTTKKHKRKNIQPKPTTPTTKPSPTNLPQLTPLEQTLLKQNKIKEAKKLYFLRTGKTLLLPSTTTLKPQPKPNIENKPLIESFEEYSKTHPSKLPPVGPIAKNLSNYPKYVKGTIKTHEKLTKQIESSLPPKSEIRASVVESLNKAGYTHSNFGRYGGKIQLPNGKIIKGTSFDDLVNKLTDYQQQIYKTTAKKEAENILKLTKYSPTTLSPELSFIVKHSKNKQLSKQLTQLYDRIQKDLTTSGQARPQDIKQLQQLYQQAYESLPKEKQADYNLKYLDWSQIPVTKLKYIPGGKTYIKQNESKLLNQLENELKQGNKQLAKEVAERIKTKYTLESSGSGLEPLSELYFGLKAGTKQPNIKSILKDILYETPEESYSKYYERLSPIQRTGLSVKRAVVGTGIGIVTFPELVAEQGIGRLYNIATTKQNKPVNLLPVSETISKVVESTGVESILTTPTPGLVEHTMTRATESIGLTPKGESEKQFKQITKHPVESAFATVSEIGTMTLAGKTSAYAKTRVSSYVKPKLSSVVKKSYLKPSLTLKPNVYKLSFKNLSPLRRLKTLQLKTKTKIETVGLSKFGKFKTKKPFHLVAIEEYSKPGKTLFERFKRPKAYGVSKYTSIETFKKHLPKLYKVEEFPSKPRYSSSTKLHIEEFEIHKPFPYKYKLKPQKLSFPTKPSTLKPYIEHFRQQHIRWLESKPSLVSKNIAKEVINIHRNIDSYRLRLQDYIDRISKHPSYTPSKIREISSSTITSSKLWKPSKFATVRKYLQKQIFPSSLEEKIKIKSLVKEFEKPSSYLTPSKTSKTFIKEVIEESKRRMIKPGETGLMLERKTVIPRSIVKTKSKGGWEVKPVRITTIEEYKPYHKPLLASGTEFEYYFKKYKPSKPSTKLTLKESSPLLTKTKAITEIKKGKGGALLLRTEKAYKPTYKYIKITPLEEKLSFYEEGLGFARMTHPESTTVTSRFPTKPLFKFTKPKIEIFPKTSLKTKLLLAVGTLGVATKLSQTYSLSKLKLKPLQLETNLTLPSLKVSPIQLQSKRSLQLQKQKLIIKPLTKTKLQPTAPTTFYKPKTTPKTPKTTPLLTFTSNKLKIKPKTKVSFTPTKKLKKKKIQFNYKTFKPILYRYRKFKLPSLEKLLKK